MRPHEIENWALNIIDRVRSRQPIEDSRVELKAEWPDDPAKAARRLAGHANAARGEPILWLIGVDEKQGTVPGVGFTDLSTWYSTVRAQFDELAPEPVSINVPVQGVTVAALYFETGRAPFVVKNPEGGTIQRAVPWREATGVQSATRSQLLRLLSPLQKLPQLEAIAGQVVATPLPQPGDLRVNMLIRLALYLTQPPEQQTFIPSHRCTIALAFSGGLTLGPFGPVQFDATPTGDLSATREALSVRGPALFEADHRVFVPIPGDRQSVFGQNVTIRVALWLANLERSISVDLQMVSSRKSEFAGGVWTAGDYVFDLGGVEV